jgi:hypothetical protein
MQHRFHKHTESYVGSSCAMVRGYKATKPLFTNPNKFEGKDLSIVCQTFPNTCPVKDKEYWLAFSLPYMDLPGFACCGVRNADRSSRSLIWGTPDLDCPALEGRQYRRVYGIDPVPIVPRPARAESEHSLHCRPCTHPERTREISRPLYLSLT